MKTNLSRTRKSEEALRESKQKYKFLTENMNDILWVMDMELRTNYVSPSIENVLGFSPGERVRQDVTEQLTPASLLVASETLSKELAHEKQGSVDKDRSISLILEFYHKDGSTPVAGVGCKRHS